MTLSAFEASLDDRQLEERLLNYHLKEVRQTPKCDNSS